MILLSGKPLGAGNEDAGGRALSLDINIQREMTAGGKSSLLDSPSNATRGAADGAGRRRRVRLSLWLRAMCETNHHHRYGYPNVLFSRETDSMATQGIAKNVWSIVPQHIMFHDADESRNREKFDAIVNLLPQKQLASVLTPWFLYEYQKQLRRAIIARFWASFKSAAKSNIKDTRGAHFQKSRHRIPYNDRKVSVKCPVHRLHSTNFLLSGTCADTEHEGRYLECLKQRFGEAQLNACEVRLRDLADSRRLNAHLASGDIPHCTKVEVDVSTIVATAQFWPTFKENRPLEPWKCGYLTNGTGGTREAADVTESARVAVGYTVKLEPKNNAVEVHRTTVITQLACSAIVMRGRNILAEVGE
ncbi:hypothetical protein HPB49_021915 [Dermacentor silvarum]|uniref:Uncharacterized protein n=1 Tax=Dermacentor silvarum TaxID=543639 RepID=A0ACB8E2U6_DERSI|nr:hypothetical protein HPB49_021915 [Dermacentor silvarum]